MSGAGIGAPRRSRVQIVEVPLDALAGRHTDERAEDPDGRNRRRGGGGYAAFGDEERPKPSRVHGQRYLQPRRSEPAGAYLSICAVIF